MLAIMPTSATTLCGPRNGRRGSRSATQIRASTVLGRPISPSVGDRRVGSRAGSVTLVGIALVGIALASWRTCFAVLTRMPSDAGDFYRYVTTS